MAGAKKQTVATAPEWRRFPQMENIFDKDGRAALMKKVEGTCRKLDEIAQRGVGTDRERATAALVAYGRALELVGELAMKREAMAAEKPNIATPAQGGR